MLFALGGWSRSRQTPAGQLQRADWLTLVTCVAEPHAAAKRDSSPSASAPAAVVTVQPLARKRSRPAEEAAEEVVAIACPPKTRQRRQQEDAALTDASETLALFGALLGMAPPFTAPTSAGVMA